MTDYYSALKGIELAHATTLTDLEDITLSDVSQIRKDEEYMISLM